MSTSRKLTQTDYFKSRCPTFPTGIRLTLRPLKLMLLGLLVMCIAITSGCGSNSKRPEPAEVSVDASLMVKPNLTTSLLEVLSK